MKTVFPAALLLAFVSGGAGLAHQILWTRRLVDVLGASAGTFSKVIGAFFVGLALGSWLASRVGANRISFWKIVALAELGVAVFALPALFSPALGNWLVSAGSVEWLKWLLPLLLVTPPAVAMGLVIPWMVRALALDEGFVPRHTVWLYAVNTLGGVAGIAFVVLAGLPRLGLNGASLAAIGLNLLVAAAAFALSLSGRSRRKEAQIFQSEIDNPQSAINQSLMSAPARA